MPAEFAAIFPALAGETLAGPETLALSRGVFLDNTASEQGAAVDAGEATVRLGNLLAARNRVTTSSASAGALSGSDITLINATVVGNGSTGVVLAAPSRSLALVNSIVADNAGANCIAPPGKLVVKPASLQYPGTTCGNATSRAPKLDRNYAPSLLSPARIGGDVSSCLGDPLVAGRDLHGASRGNSGSCSIGAIEPNLERDLFAGTAIQRSGVNPWDLSLWLLLLFLLLGLIFALKRARSRRRCAAGSSPAGESAKGASA
jgi:hypothetical protein